MTTFLSVFRVFHFTFHSEIFLIDERMFYTNAVINDKNCHV